MVETLGKRLKELRIEKGLTQVELARAIGVGKSIISMWEKDQCEPGASKIDALALYFNVTCDYIIRGDR